MSFSIGAFFSFVVMYFKKKGENAATKEDIAQITHEIKNVENVFSEKLASHVARLDINKTLRISYRSKEQELLLRFHELACELINDSFFIGVKEKETLDFFKSKVKTAFLEQQKEILRLISRIRLLVMNDDVLVVSRRLYDIATDASIAGVPLNIRSIEIIDQYEIYPLKGLDTTILDLELQEVNELKKSNLAEYECAFLEAEKEFIDVVRRYLMSKE